jgi:ABC transporter substrate binding protein (PQQ-dependent alcohol dehydrogenase system)
LIRILLAFCLAATPALADGAKIVIPYVYVPDTRHIPSTMLDPPPSDAGVAGAVLAVADNATTGAFLGQSFSLDAAPSPTEAEALARAGKLLASGTRVLVADLPAPALLKLADLPGAKSAIILDATSADDRLRGADCRANTLHMLPSRAMLADGLMQYLVAKTWRSIMLLTGKTPEDVAYADAVRKSAAKFQVEIEADRAWTFNPAAQQADTGHYQVNAEVNTATQGASYDVLVVADEEDAFGDQVAFRTASPRPVTGTQGLVATAWAKPMDEFASTQLQGRFLRANHRWMTPRDYGAWLAVRAVGEAATRSGSADPGAIAAFLKNPEFRLAGYKGAELSFRAWDGQLRQPVLLADAVSLVSVSPQPGFLHERDELDSLGVDAPETECHPK